MSVYIDGTPPIRLPSLNYIKSDTGQHAHVVRCNKPTLLFMRCSSGNKAWLDNNIFR